MVRKRKSTKKAKASASTCSILKKRISTASNRSTRGKALGAFAKAGCAQRAKKRKHHKR